MRPRNRSGGMASTRPSAAGPGGQVGPLPGEQAGAADELTGREHADGLLALDVGPHDLDLALEHHVEALGPTAGAQQLVALDHVALAADRRASSVECGGVPGREALGGRSSLAVHVGDPPALGSRRGLPREVRSSPSRAGNLCTRSSPGLLEADGAWPPPVGTDRGVGGSWGHRRPTSRSGRSRSTGRVRWGNLAVWRHRCRSGRRPFVQRLSAGRAGEEDGGSPCSSTCSASCSPTATRRRPRTSSRSCAT